MEEDYRWRKEEREDKGNGRKREEGDEERKKGWVDMNNNG